MSALPVFLLVVLYIPSLGSAYRDDDFAWLSLRNTISNGHSLWWALFSPQAQGSIRPLGERVWFLAASSLFGLNPVPLHLLALLTQIGNVFLVVAVGRRLLRSPMAAGIAATLWVLSDSLVEPMVWASAYNEILYTFWFLLAFGALIRWIDSGISAWFALHIAAVVLGLATLELMITFPVIAAAWVALFVPKRWRAVIPSAALAGLFILIHLFAVRFPRSGPYRMSFGWSLINNFLHYWTSVLGPAEYGRIHQTSAGMTLAGTLLISASVLLWVIIGTGRKLRTGPFCLLWFALGLLPVLPLSAHATAYYAFLPLIGLAWLAGDALVRAPSWPVRSLALACAVLYASCEIPSTLFVRDWYRARSSEVEERERRLADAVQQIRHVQPSGPVFLTRIDSGQFWWGLCYGELIRRGFTDLHILPDAAGQGVAIPPREWCIDPNIQLSPDETARLVRVGEGEVYDVSSVPPRIAPANNR
jgi:hypothetical protein